MRKLFSHAVRAGLLCLGVSAGATAQNLVANGNFDQQYGSSGPTRIEANVKSSFPNAADELPGWQAFTYSTPDYFATNGPGTPPAGAPAGTIQSSHGPVLPHNSQPGVVNGLVGLYGSYGQTINGANNTQRFQEYLAPLQPITPTATGKYYLTMRVLRSTDSNAATYIGLNLETSQPNPTSSDPPPTYGPAANSAQSSSAIADTQNWTLVQNTVTLSAGTTYWPNIGNFGPYQPPYNQSAPVVKAYYFIDAVGIYAVPEGSRSVSACPNTQVLLGSSPDAIPGVTYAWTVEGSSNPPFSSAPQVSVPAPAAATTYVLTTYFPDGNVYTSKTTVTPAPGLQTLGVYPVASSGCPKTQTFRIYGPNSTYTYSVSILSGDIRLQSPNPVTGDFTFEATTTNSAGGRFRLTQTNACGVSDFTDRDVSFPAPETVGGTYVCGYAPSNGSPVGLSSAQQLNITNPEGADVGVTITKPNYQYRFTSDRPDLDISYSTSYTTVHFILKPGQGVTITATAINAPASCTPVGRFAFYAPARRGYAASPNPASTALTVSAEEAAPVAQATPAEAPVPFEAALFDNLGRQVRTQRSTQGRAVLDVHDLPAGLYYLRSGTGKDAVSKVVEVRH